MNKGVFIGYHNIAGVGLGLKKGFEENGYKAYFYSKEKTQHKYNYRESDAAKSNNIQFSKYKIIRYFQALSHYSGILLKCKYFIYLIGAEGYLFTNFKDIKILRFFKKKTIVVFTGCDTRVPAAVEKYKWNPCRDCPDAYKNFVGCRIPEKEFKIKKLEKQFDYIFSPHECAGFLEREYSDIRFPAVEPLKSKESKRNEKIRILHAPSNEDYKGSKHIYKSIKEINAKYSFEFVKADNLSKEELIDEIYKSDLIIDQMIGGFYGVFAIESMFAEKPVICYIREDIWEKMKDDCPVINANPDTLTVVLEEILKNPEKLKDTGRKSREYAIKYHSPQNVARYMMNIIEAGKN